VTIIDILNKNKGKNAKLKKINKNRIKKKDDKNKIDKRSSDNKKSGFGNQSGLYHRLPKKKQSIIKSIIDILEKEN
jgi:hypothetical protein